MRKPINTDNLAFRATIAAAPDDLMLTRYEVAAFLNITTQTMFNGMLDGSFPKPKVIKGMSRNGKRWRLGDIRAMMKEEESV